LRVPTPLRRALPLPPLRSAIPRPRAPSRKRLTRDSSEGASRGAPQRLLRFPAPGGDPSASLSSVHHDEGSDGNAHRRTRRAARSRRARVERRSDAEISFPFPGFAPLSKCEEASAHIVDFAVRAAFPRVPFARAYLRWIHARWKR